MKLKGEKITTSTIPQNANNMPMQGDVMEAFANLNQKNDMAEVVKELFDGEKIYMIGDLTREEINIATRIYMIAKLKKIDSWMQGLEFFCKLMLSKDRKSRKEILQAIQGYNQQMSFMQKMNPMNWRGGRM